MTLPPPRISRCSIPPAAPYTWQDHVNQTDPSVLELAAWLSELTPFARDHEEGAIDELFERAALGRLQDTGDETTPIKAIHSDPDIYELRRTALSKKLRFYHGEPPKYPWLLVHLHQHIKVNTPLQQIEIEKAIERYRPQRQLRTSGLQPKG